VIPHLVSPCLQLGIPFLNIQHCSCYFRVVSIVSVLFSSQLSGEEGSCEVAWSQSP
jgi:hypothetical protein